MLLDLIAVVLDQIRRFLHVADALEPILSGLISHERRQLPPAIANLVCDFLEQGDAVAPRPRTPRRERGFGRGNRLAYLLAARALEHAEKYPRVDRAAI